MEEQNTKSSGLIKQFIQDLGISKAQKWILTISCLLVVVALILMLQKHQTIGRYYESNSIKGMTTEWYGSYYTKTIYHPNKIISSIFFSMIVSFCYTIILYRNDFLNSKYKWIPLGMCLIGTFIHTPLTYIHVGLDEWFYFDNNVPFLVFLALLYVISVICVYKWETISKQETKWIPFVSAMIANFMLFILLIFTHSSL